MEKAVGLIILAIGIMAGCTVKESAELTETHLVFTTSREYVTPDTRSVRQEDGSVWWGPKEEISMFYGSGTNGGSKFTSTNSALAETVEFEGSISISGSKEFWAIYPYSTDNSCDGTSITTVIPHQQSGVEGNFSNDAFPAMAKASSMSLPFWNICGGVKFFVSRSDIKSVTIKGNNGEALAGKVKVAFNAEGKPEVTEVLDGKTEVTLEAPDGGSFKPGKYYYVTLLPTALDGGISLTFYTSSEKGEIVSDNAQIIKRSIFGVLKKVDSAVTEWESTVVEPENVDLGLSVKWASFNVGATKPEEYGDYFAWGETEPKEYYSSSTYKFQLGTDYFNGPFSKYVIDSNCGTVDNKTVLDLEDDAAHVNWGGSWRMPTDAELTELRENCTWIWTSNYNGTGIAGRVVTGSNGNSIFLPAAGFPHETDMYNVGSYGYLWSSSLRTDHSGYARRVYFCSDEVDRNIGGRCGGYSIRPVYGEFIPVSSISLSESSLNLEKGSSAQLTATIAPTNATELSVRWVSGNNSIVTVDQNGNVSAVAEGTTTVTAYASNGLSATCVVTVPEIAAEPEWVDLGLPSGLKWATFNVGATKPEEYGDYFAWGETEPKSASNTSSMYKWYNGGYNKITKYCAKSSYWAGSGPLDNKTVLDLEDDAAHVNWGGSWRMPTDKECTELIDNCTWTWTSDYNGTGIAGRIGSASNGNSIFLPAAGCWHFDDIYSVGYSGGCWSSSLYPAYSDEAWYINFYSDDINWRTGSRDDGQAIRPVYGEFISVSSILLNESELELHNGESAQLSATVSPSNATAPNVRWVSDNESVVSVNQEGSLTANSVGMATITVYSSNGLNASCVVNVLSTPKAVDLGLSVKWASFNLGATRPEECGDYFAWGETEPKSDYSWSTYKWCNGDKNKLTKYCPSDKTDFWDGSGSPDNKTVLDLEDDAAHVILGGIILGIQDRLVVYYTV